MTIPLLILMGYLFGSIPTGFIIGRIFFGGDVRSSGSGATGATNIARQFGIGWAVLVGIVDLIKGAGAVLIAGKIAPDIGWIAAVVGIAAILGHIYPVWIGFRGGKGVNTALGVAIVMSPIAMFFGIIAFAAAFAISRFVSVGSISAVIMYSIAVLAFGSRIGSTGIDAKIFAIALPIIVIWTHRGNIKRLIKGKELRPVKNKDENRDGSKIQRN